MPKTDNQTVISSHDKLLERASKRYPERKFIAKNDGMDGNDATELDNLEDSIIDMFDELDASIAENDKKNAELRKILEDDPRSHEFLSKWIEYGDPAAALFEVFGDNISSMNTEEGRAQYKEQLDKWKAARENEDRISEERTANWDKSLADLEEWGNSKGLDNEQKAKVLVRLIDIAAGGVLNKYVPEDFEMIWKDLNYDDAVARARQEGEVTGRNERIRAEKRTRSTAAAVPPALAGGQGVRAQADKPEQKPSSPWEGLK